MSAVCGWGYNIAGVSQTWNLLLLNEFDSTLQLPMYDGHAICNYGWFPCSYLSCGGFTSEASVM